MKLNSNNTIFVPIDMQAGIVANGECGPHSVQAVIANNNKIVVACDSKQIEIGYINVAFDLFKYIGPNQETTRTSNNSLPADYLDIVIDQIANSTVITKYTPSAFYNTQLDSIMRFKGYDTIVLSGVITSNGVYATALDAYQKGYKIIIVEDAMTDREAEVHNFFINKMYPKIATVVTTEALIESLA